MSLSSALSYPLLHFHQILMNPPRFLILKWFFRISSTIVDNNPISWPNLHLSDFYLSLTACNSLHLLVTDMSTAVGQVVACAPVMQRARVRSPVGTSFLGEVFLGVFPRLKDKCREALGPQGPRISFGHHYHHQSLRAPMTWALTRPKTSNLHLHVN